MIRVSRCLHVRRRAPAAPRRDVRRFSAPTMRRIAPIAVRIVPAVRARKRELAQVADQGDQALVAPARWSGATRSPIGPTSASSDAAWSPPMELASIAFGRRIRWRASHRCRQRRRHHLGLQAVDQLEIVRHALAGSRAGEIVRTLKQTPHRLLHRIDHALHGRGGRVHLVRDAGDQHAEAGHLLE